MTAHTNWPLYPVSYWMYATLYLYVCMGLFETLQNTAILSIVHSFSKCKTSMSTMCIDFSSKLTYLYSSK